MADPDLTPIRLLQFALEGPRDYEFLRRHVEEAVSLLETEPHRSLAYRSGYDARISNEKLEDNPYNGDLKEDWKRGWFDANSGFLTATG